MTTRHAACSCGQLHLTIEGESARISMCHCLACQRRTGAVFSNQARLPGASRSPSPVRLRRGIGQPKARTW
jgi:hypothetical protein